MSRGILLGVALALASPTARLEGATPAGAVRVPADPTAGFSWPYYLLASSSAERRGERGDAVTLMIITSNTGKTSDNLSVHEDDVVRRLDRDYRGLAEALGVVVLAPVLPRPATHSHVYTHALDRDALMTDLSGLERLDLQLAAMQDDARERLVSRGWTVNPRALLVGFSASGMFANRFAVLHPERVLAAAIGSPGGWPLAPVSTWEGRRLPYPVGVADVEELTGRPVDLEALRRVPFLFFLGEEDENDSVDYDDGYDGAGRRLVRELFGSRPVDRWPEAERLYAAAGLEARFELYPGVGHTMAPEMIREVTAFLRRSLEEAGATP